MIVRSKRRYDHEKNEQKNRNAILSLVALLSLGLVAGTIAYFSTATSFDNIFAVKNPEAQFVEEFEAPTPDELIYGGEFSKKGQVINTGDYPVVARAQITAYWDAVDKATGNVLSVWEDVSHALHYYHKDTDQWYTKKADCSFEAETPGDTSAFVRLKGNSYNKDLLTTDPELKDQADDLTNPLDKDGNAATLTFQDTATFPTDATDFPFAAIITANTGDWLYTPATPADGYGYFYYIKLVPAMKGGAAGTSSYLLDSVYIDGALGVTKKTDSLYFAKDQYDDYFDAKAALDRNAALENNGAIDGIYTSQEEFTKAGLKDGNGVPYIMVAAKSSVLVYPQYQNAQLTVTISSLIVQADDRSVEAAYGISASSSGTSKTIYDAWVADGLVLNKT